MEQKLYTDFLNICEMSLSELKLEQFDKKNTFFNHTYCLILIAYFESDISFLKKEIDLPVFTKEEKLFLQQVGPLRLGIRENKINLQSIYDAISVADFLPEELKAELLFVIAMAYENNKNYNSAKNYYFESYSIFKNLNANIKSLKALNNFLANVTRIDSGKTYISEFNTLYRMAKRQKNRSVAGIALSNIGREYHKMNCLHSALKYTNRALLYLDQDIGTIHYDLTRANRCAVLLDLNSISQACIDFEYLQKSKFSEVQSCLAVMESIFTKKSLPISKSTLPSWIEQFSNWGYKNDLALSVHEEQLLVFVSKAPRLKNDIIEHLYGNNIGLSSADGRFRNLLIRLNKKMPGVIVQRNHFYYLAADVDMTRVI